MNRTLFFIPLATLIFWSSIATSGDTYGNPPFPPPPPHSPGSPAHGSTGFRPCYPPGVMPCPPVPPHDLAPGWGAIFFPGWYHHYYAPYYNPQEDQKPSYYQGVKTAGEIRVVARPAGAKVFVDGVELTDSDSGNAFTMGVLTGTHTVEVQAEGYQPYSKKVTVETAQTTSLSVELKRQ